MNSLKRKFSARVKKNILTIFNMKHFCKDFNENKKFKVLVVN